MKKARGFVPIDQQPVISGSTQTFKGTRGYVMVDRQSSLVPFSASTIVDGEGTEEPFSITNFKLYLNEGF